jgi:hypothetical protein
MTCRTMAKLSGKTYLSVKSRGRETFDGVFIDVNEFRQVFGAALRVASQFEGRAYRGSIKT